jgi:ATP-grasp domain
MVSAVCPMPSHPCLKTRAVRQVFPYSRLRPLESLITAIAAFDPQIIVPCDERGLRHLHQLHAWASAREGRDGRIATLIERSLGAPESYPIVSSRHKLLCIARDERILAPATNSINTVEELDAWSAQQPLPWVLKADGTWGGGGVRFAHSRQEADQFFKVLSQSARVTAVLRRLILQRDRLRYLAELNRSKRPVIVQAYVQGRPANCAVVCWQGKILAGIGVEAVSAESPEGPAIVVRVVNNSAMMLAAERIARRLSLSGFFGLDFMIEDGTNHTYLIEMNPRCTPLSHLQLGRGRDLVGALKAQLAGEPFVETPSVTRNDMIAYFPRAWVAQSEFLQSSFQDVPQDEPELIKAILHPWSERSVVGRAVDSLQQLLGKRDVAKPCVFPAAIPAPALPETSEV